MCFDNNKDDDKKPMRMISRLSPENSRIKRKIQEKFQVSSFQESRIKNNQDQDSRLKIQE